MQKYRNILIIFISYLCNISYAEVTDLLEIPMLNNNEKIVYQATLASKCEFEKSDILALVRKNGKEVKSDLNFIEKFYFSIKKQEVNEYKVVLQIEGASKLSFTFELKNCKLTKRVEINGEEYQYDYLTFYYKDYLGAPVLEKFQIHKDEKIKEVYSKYVAGHVPLYEFLIGAAFEMKTNISKNNEKTYYKEDIVLKPIPTFIIRYGTLFLNKDGAGTLLGSYSGISLLGFINYDGEPYEGSGLQKRRKDFFSGVLIDSQYMRIFYKKNWFGLDEEYKGYEYKFVLKHSYRPSLRVRIEPRFYLQYWDNDYSNYYYGISGTEASRSNFTSYHVSGAVMNLSFKTRVEYYDENILYFMDGGYKRYDSKIESSPIVRSANEWSLVSGVVYKVF